MSRSLGRPLLASPIASSSRAPAAPRIIVRTAATQSPADARLDLLRRTLYPSDAVFPSSASPTGAYATNHLERLKTVVPSAEAYETIERAWKLYQRDRRQQRAQVMQAKFDSMREACAELERITAVPSQPSATSEDTARERTAPGQTPPKKVQPQYPRHLYDRAFSRVNLFPIETPKVRGSRAGPESRFQEARIEGLVPREAWIPTDTRGKAWNYGWRRPGTEK